MSLHIYLHLGIEVKSPRNKEENNKDPNVVVEETNECGVTKRMDSNQHGIVAFLMTPNR